MFTVKRKYTIKELENCTIIELQNKRIILVVRDVRLRRYLE